MRVNKLPTSMLPTCCKRACAASAASRVRYNPKSAEPDPDSEAIKNEAPKGEVGTAASGGAATRKKTLDFSKGRMLGKDDSFEVVLDPALIPVRTSADS